jgi:hypothetical protein
MTKHCLFRSFQTSPQIIRLAVMSYVRFPLSLRNARWPNPKPGTIDKPDSLYERGTTGGRSGVIQYLGVLSGNAQVTDGKICKGRIAFVGKIVVHKLTRKIQQPRPISIVSPWCFLVPISLTFIQFRYIERRVHYT